MGGEAMEEEISIPPEKEKSKEDGEESESEKEVEEGGGGVQIPLYRWLMHGAVMFGREFCYAIETALVTPVLLQIGLPQQYYSLTWFLSPFLGLILTPVIGSASDRCTLSLGRRRPFILALCVGVLLGVALFLNGSLIGLSIGDRPNNQTIGIVLTVLGVVVLDFCADAAEGPIRAYLLDVADTEEQDMALNIHAFSAGLGGATGYMLGGLDWTGTALGKAFKTQEQVLFFFAGIFFIISVTLHMFSIREQPLTKSKLLNNTMGRRSSSQLSIRTVGPSLNVITEEVHPGQAPSGQEKISEFQEENVDFLAEERVRSKSDSILALPDATIEIDPDLDLDRQIFLPETHFEPELNGDLANAFKASDDSNEPPTTQVDNTTREPKKTQHQALSELKFTTNGRTLIQHNCDSEDSRLKKVNVTGLPASHSSQAPKVQSPSKSGNRTTNAFVTKRPRAHSFYRQPSFTFSIHGRARSQRYRLQCPGHVSPPRITASRSLNDLSDIHWPKDRTELRLPSGSLSSEGSVSDNEAEKGTTVKLLWQSMFKMPTQLWRLCICHLLTWFSYIAESVFYTDFMGQVIFNGDPTAPSNSTELLNYNKGVQMGSWGLVVNAVTAALSSALLQKYLDNFNLSIKVIYVVGTLGFSIGTALMAIFPNVYVVMVMISSMGLLSMSISYCPYALLGQYHEIKEYVNHSPADTRRGFGIDCAILSCQVYISQILVASALGSLVDAVGSVHVIPVVASGGSFLGFLSACFLVIYPDVESSESEQDQGLVGVVEQEEQSEERTSGQRLAQLEDRDTLGRTNPTLTHK